jgi:hypothetical protein
LTGKKETAGRRKIRAHFFPPLSTSSTFSTSIFLSGPGLIGSFLFANLERFVRRSLTRSPPSD